MFIIKMFKILPHLNRMFRIIECLGNESPSLTPPDTTTDIILQVKTDQEIRLDSQCNITLQKLMTKVRSN